LKLESTANTVAATSQTTLTAMITIRFISSNWPPQTPIVSLRGDSNKIVGHRQTNFPKRLAASIASRSYLEQPSG